MLKQLVDDVLPSHRTPSDGAIYAAHSRAQLTDAQNAAIDAALDDRDVLFDDDDDDEVTIAIRLTVADMRKIVEAETGEPCFRMWLSRDEVVMATAQKHDWTFHPLEDGRWAAWRKVSDLTALWLSGKVDDHKLARFIEERKIEDDVT